MSALNAGDKGSSPRRRLTFSHSKYCSYSQFVTKNECHILQMTVIIHPRHFPQRFAVCLCFQTEAWCKNEFYLRNVKLHQASFRN